MRQVRLAPLILVIIASFTLGLVFCVPTYTPLPTIRVRDDSINASMVFDGANYIYITPYGNYTWLQPGNILRFTDYRGQEIIEKSVFVTQYESYGNWLPLLDFYDSKMGDPVVTVANDTYYEWQYNIYDKKIQIATGKLSFTVDPNPEILPKIHTEITPHAQNWGGLGYTDLRWIWDVVPYVNATTNEGFTYYHNQTSGKLIDVRDFTELRELYTAQPNINDTLSYEEINNQARIKIFDNQTRAFSGVLDVSSYNATTWYGGQEPNWNSKGFVTIFPVNEAVIDPITYTEAMEDISPGATSGWQEVDAGNAPAYSVAVVIATNSEANQDNHVGARNTSSSVDRRIELNEAESGGNTAMRWLVNVDGSGNIDLYDDDATVLFTLVGYFEDVNFTEQWDSHTVSSSEDNMWTELDGPADLDLVADGVHLITMTNSGAGAEWSMGVRQTGGSDPSRYIDVMESEGGGNQVRSMYVQANGNGDIDCFLEYYAVNTLWNQGHFDSQVAFTEDIQGPHATGSGWTDWDLSATIGEAEVLCDFSASHSGSGVERSLGARQNGGSLNRYFDIREAEDGPTSGYSMEALSDSSGICEMYNEDGVGDRHYFLGYFTFTAGIVEYQRAVTQGVSLSGSGVRAFDAIRGLTQGMTASSSVSRLFGVIRGLTQGITVGRDTTRTYDAIRGLTQGITAGSSITRTLDAIRGLTQGITASSAVSRAYGVIRGLIQSITVGSDTTRTYDAIRGLTQSVTASSSASRLYTIIRGLTQGITIGSDVNRVFGAIRGLTQSVTASSSASRLYTIIRGLTQGIGVAVSVVRQFDGFRGISQSITLTNQALNGWITMVVHVIDFYNQDLANVTISVWSAVGSFIDQGLTNGTGIYNAGNVFAGNYSIQAYLEGQYETLWGNYTLYDSSIIELTLRTWEEAIVFNMELFVFALLGIIFTLIMVLSPNVSLGIISGGMSFVIWFITGIYFMYSNSYRPDSVTFGLVFPMIGVICGIFTLYGAFKTLSPQEKGGILED